MEVKQCFELGCMLEVDCYCPCTSPETYSCRLHIEKHLQLPGSSHNVEYFFVEPYEGTKETILEFLSFKEKIINSFLQRLFESHHDLSETIKDIGSYSAKISDCIAKISEAKKIPKSEEDPILGLLSLQPEKAIEKLEIMIPANPDWCKSAKWICGFSEKIEKMIDGYVKDKFEALLDKRLLKIESAIEEHNKVLNVINCERIFKIENDSEKQSKAIGLARQELTNIKVSISELIDENKKSKKEFDDWMETIRQKTENDKSLLNAQITRLTEDINRKLNRAQNIQVSEILTPQELREKSAEILNKPCDLELEWEFRKTCSMYEKNIDAYDPALFQAYQSYVNTYNQKSSVYLTIANKQNTELLIYNTENEIAESLILETPVQLSNQACITQLPDGKLFCFGDQQKSGATLLIDNNWNIQVLPSGTPCSFPSAIYFNRSVYCFGGQTPQNPLQFGYWFKIQKSSNQAIIVSDRFDLYENKWIKLAPMPIADEKCSSAVFNGNILISGWKSKNLLRYSIDSDTYSVIPFEFAQNCRKILINAGEKLYLIECLNSIYESEIGSESAWIRIGASNINNDPEQILCSYNKGAIYIGCNNNKSIGCYKFDLTKRYVVELKSSVFQINIALQSAA